MTSYPIATAALELVLGADIGGTSTRIALATTSGEVVATATGGPGNPAAVGLSASVATVRDVVTEARKAAATRLDGSSDQPIVAATVGLAGVSTLDHETAARFRDEVFGPDHSYDVRLVSDFAVAYSSGTWHSHGLVTIAGTGSGAMEIRDGDQLARRDGWGWLLGDEGSGWWLGREAVRASLRELEHGTDPGPLTRSVLTTLGTTGAADTIAECYRRGPRELSVLARLVSDALPDPAAADILDRAAALVSRRLVDLADGRSDLAIVLAGSLVTGSGPLAEPVRHRLQEAGFAAVHEAGDGLAGALWLALTGRGGRTQADPGGDTGGPARQWSALLGSLGVCRGISPHHM
ncbi:MAG TPA: hypothetical protein IAA98_07845 [Candidatus Avipropionibacterium avicola]|uniref:ATPase BadF/BadG/BcrA/BcrD type domain-containing protein n=1 Tax=Candidatus Avipropionibacterium avicola TaxID=2840701 RepID=A0A9D1KMH6_9ACTN|nr:hypothetical protein [Candidatus Avipropionibacterium avicola]